MDDGLIVRDAKPHTGFVEIVRAGRRLPELAGLVRPGQRNGYDLIVWAGTLRIAESSHCWQVGEGAFRWSDSVFGDTNAGSINGDGIQGGRDRDGLQDVAAW